MRDALKTILSNKDNKDGMQIQSIVDALIMGYPEVQGEMTREKLLNKVNAFLLKESKDKKGDFTKVRKGVYRFVARKRNKPLPKPFTFSDAEDPQENTQSTRKKDTNFFGKAGEYAVMAELLFQEYNANNMAVDEGIDIIASKNNNFYFVQVKTMTLNPDRKARATIKMKNFDKFINQQMRYVLAIKCSNEIKFFTLTNESIDLLLQKEAIGRNKDGSLSIKIKYEEDGRVFFYDTKEEEARFWEGIKIELRSIQ